jgi:hypothetical protein
MGRLPHGKDLLTTLENFCREEVIQMGSFFLIGAVSKATFGAYDQDKQEYVSYTRQEPLEIIQCSGNVSMKDGKPFVHAHILFGDELGNTFGGHLFSDTILFAGEIDFMEVKGIPLAREFDAETGLALWNK